MSYSHTITVPDRDEDVSIKETVEAALKECETVLPSKEDITFDIQHTDDRFVTETMDGSTGSTIDANTIVIEVNTDAAGWKQALRSTVIHEYNHALWHQIHGKDWKSVTLGELVAMEGLAQNFEEALTGKPPVYATHVSKDRLGEIWTKVQDHLAENGKEWWQRLSFEDSKEFPFWSGYSLAYSLVSRRISELKLTWPELMKAGAKELLSSEH